MKPSKAIIVLTTEWELSEHADREKALADIKTILIREVPQFAGFAKRTRLNIQEIEG